jgi:hypothetical protein
MSDFQAQDCEVLGHGKVLRAWVIRCELGEWQRGVNDLDCIVMDVFRVSYDLGGVI